VAGIIPALLQEGREAVIPYLVRIFRAWLSTGYVPVIWRLVKVVFTPKPSRNSYGGPREYRPIRLTSFLLKIMERLMDRYLRGEALALMPLHPNQHAYQAGKSVETALHRLVVPVEKALYQQETALGVFLDTEGAFNNTCYDTMCDALVRHGSDYTIVRWIRATLEGRVAVATLNGFSMRLAIARGCAQGGGGCFPPFYGAWWQMAYWPCSVEMEYSFKDTQMTYVFSRWVNSHTRYQDSAVGPSDRRDMVLRSQTVG